MLFHAACLSTRLIELHIDFDLDFNDLCHNDSRPAHLHASPGRLYTCSHTARTLLHCRIFDSIAKFVRQICTYVACTLDRVVRPIPPIFSLRRLKILMRISPCVVVDAYITYQIMAAAARQVVGQTLQLRRLARSNRLDHCAQVLFGLIQRNFLVR